MLSYFALKMLHEIIIDGLAHNVSCSIPSTCCPLLPRISVQKIEEWENSIHVDPDCTLAQLGPSLFCKYGQMEMQVVLFIEHVVRMLVLNACWSGHESIGFPYHHQPLPVRNDPL